MTGLYIHIPFCESRCIYCGFYSTVHKEWQDRYVDCLCREMDMRPCDEVSTIYLGGGTPSVLSANNLQRLFSYIYKVYRVRSDAEITMECNPDDVCRSAESLRVVLGRPVNRISMGGQTFSDSRLRMIRRRHHAKDVRDAVSLLRKAGIGNISVDLMFGFPDETLDDWRYDIDEVLALQVEHISAYSLMYEEGTPLYDMLRQGKVREVDEELSLRMYDELIDRLTAAGYEHYEISNFCRSGYRSRHNSSYWHDVPYLGIGAAAHSYNQTTRSWNVADVRRYMESIGRNVLPSECEILDENTRYDDMVTTALRTCEGILLERLDEQHRNFLLSCASPWIADGHLVIVNGHLKLTRRGIPVSNVIMSDLMDV